MVTDNKKLPEVEYTCPLCKQVMECVNIGKDLYICCRNCRANFKADSILCPTCLQRADLLPVRENESESIFSTVCWNCIVIDEFLLCLYLGYNIEYCKKCHGVGLILETEENNVVTRETYKPCKDCLSPLIPAKFFQFRENGSLLEGEKLINLLSQVFKSKKWADNITIEFHLDFKIETNKLNK